MTAVHRIQVLERKAGNILKTLGYGMVIVNDCRCFRYVTFNLTACKERDDGTVDVVMVKLKICLHTIRSLDEAAIVCRDEIRRMKKFFDRMPPEITLPRYEVWISIPSNTFQSFEFTRYGLRDILSLDETAGQMGSAA